MYLRCKFHTRLGAVRFWACWIRKKNTFFLSEKKEKTSQYKGVSWHKGSRRWQVKLIVKGHIQNGGYFKEDLDAAKKVNQLCEKLEIPLQNPGIVGENPINGSEIPKTYDDDDANASKKKRKHKKEFIANEHYFYKHFLK